LNPIINRKPKLKLINSTLALLKKKRNQNQQRIIYVILWCFSIEITLRKCKSLDKSPIILLVIKHTFRNKSNKIVNEWRISSPIHQGILTKTTAITTVTAPLLTARRANCWELTFLKTKRRIVFIRIKKFYHNRQRVLG